jgi:tetratricopeptide (TPR) repeat protein
MNLSIDQSQDLQATIDVGNLGARPIIQPDTINNRFRILRELGRGGMAVVHLAEDLSNGRQVALKMMSNSLSGSAKQRFTREFSTIASLKHPYLIEVFEYGESKSGPFFAMELFSGEPATVMTSAPALQIYEALYKLCEAIDFVHSKRIIHRDIKPANIMVQRKQDGKGFDIRLSDFGLAKFANSSSSLTGDVNFLGTLAYCAPEQIMREELDHRADLYSLGMVVYEILTGRHPFDECRKDAQALVSAQLNKTPTNAREFNKNLSVEAERAITKLLAKDPASRPNSTLDLRQALAEELGWSDNKVASASPLVASGLVAPFIARDEELKVMESFIMAHCSVRISTDSKEPLKQRSPTILFVAGEAGIGKTSLIKRAARAAFVGGAKIYDGRCFDGNLAPFQPFAEILKQILSEREKFRRRAMQSQQADVLASTTFLQAVGSTVGTTSVDSIIEEYAIDLLRCGSDLKALLANNLPTDQFETPRDTEYVFRSIGNFFVELSKIHPMLLIIDDIHWADRSSVILLRHIASSAIIARQDAEIRGGAIPQLAIVGSTRNTTEYSKTVHFVNELCESELASKLALQPLPKQSVQQLIASQLSARIDEVDVSLSDRIGTDCLGNPFYICQTIREWKLSERVIFDGLQWRLSDKETDGESLPETVREALRSRLRRLPEKTAKTLSVAAAIGSNIDVDLLQAIVGQDSDFGFFDTIDDLLGREILRETGKPRVLAFAHDLLREACLANLSATRRQGIHQVIGESLEKQRDAGKSITDAVLAEQFLAAHSNDKAFKYLLKAGVNATNTHAYVDAISLLEKAKQIAASNCSTPDKYLLSVSLGTNYAAQGQIDESLREFKSAIDNTIDPFEIAAAHFGIGKCYTPKALNSEARNHFVQALELLGERQPKSRLGLILAIIWSGICFQLLPKWTRLGKPKLPSESYSSFASSVYFANCVVIFQTDLFAYTYGSIRLALIAKYSNDIDAITLANSKYGMNMAVAGKLGQKVARRYFKDALADLDRCKSPFVHALSKHNLAAVAYFCGDLDTAEKYCLEIQSELDKARDWHAGFTLHLRRHIASQRGDAKVIEAIARTELEFGERIQDSSLIAWGKYGLADALSRLGQFDQAISLAQESQEPLSESLTRSVASQELGRTLIQSSRYEEAEQVLKNGIRQMRADLFYFDYGIQLFSLYPEAIARADWSLGPTKVPKDRRKRANRAALQSRFIAMFFPNMRAHAYRVCGRVAAANGQIRKAIGFFDSALEAATKFGNRSEYARSLIDKSMILEGEEQQRLRQEGLQQLKELHTVLPDAEIALLQNCCS